MEIIYAFFTIFFAEMGDKTQLLAIAFSTKYKIRQVLIGVFIGAFFNHGLAILFASFISRYASMDIIQVVAAAMFLFFGLWSLRLDFEEEQEEESGGSKFGPVLTVASAFFIGELGDKTQLAAMGLSVSLGHPFLVLLGTSTGMVGVSTVAILVGKILGKKIPEVTMKLVAACIFLGFGVSGLYMSLPHEYITPINALIFFVLLGGCIAIIIRQNLKKRELAREKALSMMIQSCRQCQEHQASCPIGQEIDLRTKNYLGQDLPYFGNVLSYLESFKSVDSNKGNSLQGLLDNNCQPSKPK